MPESKPDSSAPPSLGHSLLWYLLIGGAKTAASYGGFVVLVLTGMHPQLALVLTHVVVTVLGYRGHAQLAFGVRGWSGFWWYVLITNLVYGTNAGLLALFTAWSIGPVVAQALCQLVTIPLGFVLMRVCFRRTSPVAPSNQPG